MINKMESSCCHGNVKHSGQAQACAENGLIGKDTNDWGLNHKSLPVPHLIRLRVSAQGGRRSSARMQQHAAQLWLQLMAPTASRWLCFGGAEEGKPKSRRRTEEKCF